MYGKVIFVPSQIRTNPNAPVNIAFIPTADKSTAITSSAYVLLVGSFVPIPGASGGIEYSFVRFFGNFMPTVLLNALLIVWRFITYYFGMILGGFLFSTEKESD